MKNMSEIIVRLKGDHIKVKGGEYVRDYQRGEWKLSSDGYGYIGNPVYKCTVCGWWDEQTPYNFCPNCGADMRERAGE